MTQSCTIKQSISCNFAINSRGICKRRPATNSTVQKTGQTLNLTIEQTAVGTTQLCNCSIACPEVIATEIVHCYTT